MKTIDEILSQEPIYLHGWNHKVDVIGDFEDIFMDYDEYMGQTPPYANESSWLELKNKMDEALEDYKNVNILFASYGQDNYLGDAFVLFEENGKLYEVNGGHCSCYGLEGQWDPEEVLLDELKRRLTVGSFGSDDWSGNNFREELREFLGIEDVEEFK